jgi:hypothetical protein
MKKDEEYYTRIKNEYYNDNIAEIVKQIMEENKIVEYKAHLYRKIEPIFYKPLPDNFFDMRGHFYAPQKYFAGSYYSTYWFNMMVVWFYTLLLYVSLYFGLPGKIISLPELFKQKK